MSFVAKAKRQLQKLKPPADVTEIGKEFFVHKADSGRIVYLRESVATAAIMLRHN